MDAKKSSKSHISENFQNNSEPNGCAWQASDKPAHAPQPPEFFFAGEHYAAGGVHYIFNKVT